MHVRGAKLPRIDFTKFILPPAELKIVRRNGIYKVFDPLRKDYFCLTDEEFVRQVFIRFMIDHLGYPPSIMNNEIGIRLNDTYKRCDTVVFSPDGTPLVIVEYKAPDVLLSQEVFDQIVRYNMALKAKILIVSNGYKNFCCKVDYEDNSINFLKEIPAYSSLAQFI